VLRWVRERGTRDKLLGTVGGLCLVIALVGYLGLRTAMGMLTSLTYFEQVLVPSNVAAVSAREGLRNARQQASLAADPGTPISDLPRLRSQFTRYVGDSTRAIAAYQDLPLSDAEQALLSEYGVAQAAYVAATEPVWTPLAGGRDSVQTRYQTRAEPQAARMENVLSELVVLQGQRSSDEASAAHLTYASALNLLLAAIVLGTLSALVLGIIVARSIASPREEAALVHRALHDTLTGLPNRAQLNDRLAEAVAVARRASQTFALLLVDLDHFKDVNDTLGHHAGDQLLQELGRRLQASVRTGDMVARLGGDEFAVLLTGTTGRGAARVAAAAIEVLERPVMLEEREVAVGASVGIAVYPDHGDDPETLLRRADVAMYRAKQKRGSYAIYELDQDHESSDRLALVSGLRRAVAGGGLLLHYQPKIDCRSGRLMGVEALVRWPYPGRGLVPPDQFIPLAEEFGIISALTGWVLDTALAQCRAWWDLGLEVPLAVNLSAHDVQDPQLPGRVAELLERWRIPATWLTLEITERAVIANRPVAIDVVNQLARTGVRLAMDDFGTGFSSLANLQQLNIHELKIDASFVGGLVNGPTERAIVCSTIELGHQLGLETVAKGVEDQATLELLGALGCNLAQGYHIARPMAAANLVDWYAESGYLSRERTPRAA